MFCMLMFKRSIILSIALFSAVSNANSLSLEVENDVAALGTLHVQLFQSELGFSQDSKDWQSLTPYQEQHHLLELPLPRPPIQKGTGRGNHGGTQTRHRRTRPNGLGTHQHAGRIRFLGRKAQGHTQCPAPEKGGVKMT